MRSVAHLVLLFFVFEGSFTSVSASQLLKPNKTSRLVDRQIISVDQLVAALDVLTEGYVSPLELATVLDLSWARATQLFEQLSPEKHAEISIATLRTSLIEFFQGNTMLNPVELAESFKGFEKGYQGDDMQRWIRRLLNIVNRMTNEDARTLSYQQIVLWFSRQTLRIVTVESFARATNLPTGSAIKKMKSIDLIDPEAHSWAKIPPAPVARWLDMNNDGVVEADELRVRLYEDTDLSESKISGYVREIMKLARVTPKSTTKALDIAVINSVIITVILCVVSFLTVSQPGTWESSQISRLRFFGVLMASWILVAYSCYTLLHLAQIEGNVRGLHFRHGRYVFTVLLVLGVNYVLAIGLESILSASLGLSECYISATTMLFEFTTVCCSIMFDEDIPERVKTIIRPILMNFWIIFLFSWTYWQLRDEYGYIDYCAENGPWYQDPVTNATVRDCVRSYPKKRISTFLDALYFSVVTHVTTGFGDISPTDSVKGKFLFVAHCMITFLVHGVLISESFYRAGHGNEKQPDDDVFEAVDVTQPKTVQKGFGVLPRLKSLANALLNLSPDTSKAASPDTSKTALTSNGSNVSTETRSGNPNASAGTSKPPIVATEVTAGTTDTESVRKQKAVEQFMMSDS